MSKVTDINLYAATLTVYADTYHKGWDGLGSFWGAWVYVLEYR